MMEKRWSKTEITHLKRNADKKSAEDLAQRFHTDAETVREKLTELGLLPSDRSSAEQDKALETYEQALAAVHKKQWKKAAKLLEQVIDASDGRQLSDRARQYLEACRRQIEPAAEVEDAYMRAVLAKNAGDVEAALEICRTDGNAKDERYLYLTASLEALAGETEAALESLRSAIAQEPKNRIHAFHDPDFEDLRGEEGFQQLVLNS